MAAGKPDKQPMVGPMAPGQTPTGQMPAGTTSGTPQVLLAHHLKQPTVLREYDKVARECAYDGVDHPRLSWS